jgi:hypothetical protein
MDEDRQGDEAPGAGMPAAASAAITAGISLTTIAYAERVGAHARGVRWVTGSCGPSSAQLNEKREADDEYAHASVRAARLGFPHREIAAAAQAASWNHPRHRCRRGQPVSRPSGR